MPVARTAAVIAVPALASILGIMWFRRRRQKREFTGVSGEMTVSLDDVKIESFACDTDRTEVDKVTVTQEDACDAAGDVVVDELLLASDSLQTSECTESCSFSVTDLVLNSFSIIDNETVIEDAISEASCVPTYSVSDLPVCSISPGTDISLKTGTSIDYSVDMLSEDSVHSGSDSSVGCTSFNLPAYQFYFPSELCGMLIGKDGRHINGISRRSGADISVRVQPDIKHLQLVSINGSESQVRQALHAIKLRFPVDMYPTINYDNIIESRLSPQEPVHIQLTQLYLDEETIVDVLVSSVVDVDHMFVQQPTRETFRFLQVQNYLMQVCYGQSETSVPLPRPVLENTLCAAPMFNGWFRAMVVSYYCDSDECLVRFVDYGGYVRLAANLLQQIRSDFTSLPFQAVECYLSDISPPVDNLPYPDETKFLMEQLVRSQALVAQVVGYTDGGITCINLFNVVDGMLYNVTEELIGRGIARRVWPQQTF